MYDVGYIGQSLELDFVSYTRYMVYGGDRGIGRKGYRVGEYTRIGMANDFFRPLKGYYGVMELQPGQVNWGSVNSQPLPGAVRLWLWHVFAGEASSPAPTVSGLPFMAMNNTIMVSWVPTGSPHAGRTGIQHVHQGDRPAPQ